MHLGWMLEVMSMILSRSTVAGKSKQIIGSDKERACRAIWDFIGRKLLKGTRMSQSQRLLWRVRAWGSCNTLLKWRWLLRKEELRHWFILQRNTCILVKYLHRKSILGEGNLRPQAHNETNIRRLLQQCQIQRYQRLASALWAVKWHRRFLTGRGPRQVLNHRFGAQDNPTTTPMTSLSNKSSCAQINHPLKLKAHSTIPPLRPPGPK